MNIGAFVDLLIRSGLSTEHHATELVGEFSAQLRTAPSGADRITEFCDYLIASKQLTAWQCSKLRMGKWRRFYLDHYLILEQIGKDQECAYYAARDTRDGTVVRLTVTPVNRVPGPKIEYRVERYYES